MTDSIVAEDSGAPTRWRVIVIGVVVALVVAATAWLVNRPSEPAAAPTQSSPAPVTATPEPSPTPTTSPSPGPSTPAHTGYADCDPIDAEGFVPQSFQMENPEADEPVLSLGLDPEGNIAAPPKDQPRTASWWNQGPRPGSGAGKVVLSIHTYRNGGALGNEMYSDAGPTLEPGDLIRLTGEDGRTACYEFVEASKIWVDEYDVNSDVMVDYDGDPMLAIVICWDFDRDTEIWESRILFYAEPVSA